MFFTPFVSATTYQINATNVTNNLTNDGNLSSRPNDPPLGVTGWYYSDFNITDISNFTNNIIISSYIYTNGHTSYLQIYNYITQSYDTVNYTSASNVTQWVNYSFDHTQYQYYLDVIKVRSNQYQNVPPPQYTYLYELRAIANLSTDLFTPTNNSYDYFTYPDFTHDVFFSWSPGYSSSNYNIKIAKDVSFNLLTVDKTISTNYTTESLEPAIYYWKVRNYKSATGTYGNYSNVSVFYLIRNASSSGITGLEGFVYELKDETPIPISKATIYIRKEALNWSDSIITGTNGYYLFDNLTNNTIYSVTAKAEGYDDSVTEYITTIPGQRQSKNIKLLRCISGFNCFYNQHYVKFTVQNIWFTKYIGVTATVYKGSELIASDTQTTGTDGSVNFLLIKDQQYRITFINTTQGISTTWVGYPSKTEYLIITDDTYTGWDTYDTDAATTTDIEVTTQTINNTHAYVNMSYNDTLSGTSNLKFYLNKSIAGDPNNQTNLQSIDGGDNDQYNASFIVSGYGGNSYIVKVKADHNTYGAISYSYGVQFAQLPGPLANFDPTIILMLFVAFILFISGVFGQTTNAMGSGIICGLVWILAGIGMFSSANVGTNFYLALTLATIIVIIMNINERGRHEALQ